MILVLYFLRNPLEFLNFLTIKKKFNLRSDFQSHIIVEMFYDPLVFFYIYLLFFKFQKKYESNILTLIILPENLSLKKKFSIFLEKKLLNFLNIKYLELNFRNQNKNSKDINLQNIKSKRDLVQFKYQNIKIGFSIYDQYLRDTNHITIENIETNTVLKKKISHAVLAIELVKNLNISAAFIFHDTYIPYGPVKEFLLEKGMPVFGTFALQSFSFLKFKKDLYYIPWEKSKRNFFRIKKNKQQEKIEISKKILENLFNKNYQSNNLNRSLNLDKEKLEKQISSWQISNPKVEYKNNNSKKKIGLFLHSFSDAPHRFKKNVFEDYWEWTNFVLNKASQTEYEWYVKPHPLDDNPTVVNKLKMLHNKKNIYFVSHKTSNNFFIENQFKSIFTCHGTCCYEFALFDIPVVTFGECQTMSFDFNIHCGDDTKTLEEKILNAGNLKLKINKQEIYMAYYINYLFFTDFKNKIFPNNFIDNFYNKKFKVFHFGNKKLDINLFNENFDFWFNLDLENETSL